MKILTFIVSIIVIECAAQGIDSTKVVSYSNKTVLRDTIYLDTLIIDNKTKDNLELSATGNFVPEFSKEVRSLGYAKISYLLYLKGKTGMQGKGGTVSYKPKQADDNEYKTIAVLLTGLKEYEKTIRLDTLFITSATDVPDVNYINNVECKKDENVMFQFVIRNLTKDTLNILVISRDGGLIIREYSKQFLYPKESDKVYCTLSTWKLKGKFSEGINIEYSSASKQGSMHKIITRVISGQIND
ncbi:MAG TPA: hypothetical protein VKB95_08190 [Chitinophagaceae bacterium]|nr:hypothetical protein [Chitinophagaceae bacterium]